MTAGREQDARETLRALSDAATPGEWVPMIADDETIVCVARGMRMVTGPVTDADAAFIAAAVNYVRAALLPSPPATTCGCPVNAAGDIRCHVCREYVNVRCWKCRTPRGEGLCPSRAPSPAATTGADDA